LAALEDPVGHRRTTSTHRGEPPALSGLEEDHDGQEEAVEEEEREEEAVHRDACLSVPSNAGPSDADRPTRFNDFFDPVAAPSGPASVPCDQPSRQTLQP